MRALEVYAVARRIVRGGLFTDEEAVAVAVRVVELEQEVVAARREAAEAETARRFSQLAAQKAAEQRRGR